MSWSIRAEGTAEEISAQVHEHEIRYWRSMPLAERLAVHHLVGHAVEHMIEDAGSDAARRWLLVGSGHESTPGHGYGGNHTVEWGPFPGPVAPAPEVGES